MDEIGNINGGVSLQQVGQFILGQERLYMLEQQTINYSPAHCTVRNIP